MKKCPSCQNLYSDVTLSFCLQDGTPLVNQGGQSTIDTIAFGDRTTIANILPQRDFSPASDLQPNESNPNFYDGRTKSRSGLVAIAVVLTVFVVAGTGLVGGWLYFSQYKPALEKEKVHTSVPDQKQDGKTATDGPAVTASPETAYVTTGTKEDPDILRKEVVDFVTRWKETAEARKPGEYAAMYGAKVDYLGRNGVTDVEIKTENQKIFDAYSEIEIEITNLLVAVDAEGTNATAIFDKEWSYEADPKLNEGKTHTKLHLMKVRDQWKIVIEKNLKVYFNET